MSIEALERRIVDETKNNRGGFKIRTEKGRVFSILCLGRYHDQGCLVSELLPVRTHLLAEAENDPNAFFSDTGPGSDSDLALTAVNVETAANAKAVAEAIHFAERWNRCLGNVGGELDECLADLPINY